MTLFLLIALLAPPMPQAVKLSWDYPAQYVPGRDVLFVVYGQTNSIPAPSWFVNSHGKWANIAPLAALGSTWYPLNVVDAKECLVINPIAADGRHAFIVTAIDPNGVRPESLPATQ